MSLESLVSTLGLPGVAVGVALEGEGVAFLGGVIAHRGLFSVEGAAVAAVVGAVISDNVAFGAGRFADRAAPVRRVLNSGTVGRLRSALDRRPTGFILGFRFLYGMKTASAVLLGTTEVSWPRFMALEFAAAVVWAHVWVWLGYAGGAAIRGAFGQLELHLHLIVATAVAAAVVGALFGIGRYVIRSRAASAVGSG